MFMSFKSSIKSTSAIAIVRSGFSATGQQTGYSNKPKSEMIDVTGHPTSPIRISHSDLYLSGIYVV